jgi:LysM repeat protein
MPNTSPRPATPSRICPACGTRIADTASRCAVCGMVFEPGSGRVMKAPARMSGSSTSLNLPVGLVIAAPVITLILGALIMVLVLKSVPGMAGSQTTPTTPLFTPTITLTLFPTDTSAPTFTPTPLPPIVVTVKEGDTCLGLANQNGITDISLIKMENGKQPNCDALSIGQKLYIPRPTPTPPPASTATANAIQNTELACTFAEYTVVEGDSLASISANYSVPPEAIKKWNTQYSFANDVVMIGMKLRIPLCERYPTPGPTPTPTTPPPYPGPNLLTPRDGTIFAISDNEISLQWAAVASLRDTEEYQITIEDISTGSEEKTVLYEKNTSTRVPAKLKPTDGTMHIFRWSVMVVRRTGTTDAGNPLYVSAGQVSERRVFGWGGTAPAASTPTP